MSIPCQASRYQQRAICTSWMQRKKGAKESCLTSNLPKKWRKKKFVWCNSKSESLNFSQASLWDGFFINFHLGRPRKNKRSGAKNNLKGSPQKKIKGSELPNRRFPGSFDWSSFLYLTRSSHIPGAFFGWPKVFCFVLGPNTELFHKVGPEPIVINGVSYNPYKWPKIDW